MAKQMKKSLARRHMEKIEREYQEDYDKFIVHETLEEYKEKFFKLTDTDFDSLKNGSYIFALVETWYMRQMQMDLAKMKEEDKIIKYHEEVVPEYYDEDGNELVEKIQAKIQRYEDFTMYNFGRNVKDDKLHDNNSVEIDNSEIFDELNTYRRKILLSVDENHKEIHITLFEYSVYYYNMNDLIGFDHDEMLVADRSLWPHDMQIHAIMEEGIVKFAEIKKQNPYWLASEHLDLFPYAFGTPGWIKYYFKKLKPEIFTKYKDYYFTSTFDLIPVVTGDRLSSTLLEQTRVKINWEEDDL